MRTLETEADIGADGCIRLVSALPAWLKPGRRHLLLVVPEAGETPGIPAAAGLAATPEMIEQRGKALAALRASGGLRDVIPDPVEWQRALRQDRTLPGRT